MKVTLLSATALGSALLAGLAGFGATPAFAQAGPLTGAQGESCGPTSSTYDPKTGRCAQEGTKTAPVPSDEQVQAGQTEPTEPITDAQAGAGADAGADAGDEGNEIVVTGSRIVRPEFSGNIPGVQVDQEQISTRAFTNAINIINDIPLTGTGASLSGSNGAGQPTALGVAFVDLLDLGTARTLTLVNGRRFVGGNSATLFAFGNETGGQVDVNSIPTLLIDRVDVVTVGGAAAYGSDAIAGVVNFILRDNFDGVDFSVNSALTSRRDGLGYNLRALAGTNFMEDRGNVVINGEYSRIDYVSGVGRRFFSDPLFVSAFNNGGIRNPSFTATIPTNGAFLPSGSDLAPGSLGAELGESLLVSPGGNIFELTSTLSARNQVAAPTGSTFLSGVTQIIPGTPISATNAGCSTTNTLFCFFAPSGLPGANATAQAAFAQSVLATFAPTQVAVGTQAERNALAISLLQANRPTPREFLAANPTVPTNAFLSLTPTFVDVANPNTTLVTIAGTTRPLNQIFPRLAVPLQFDASGNVVPFDPGTYQADTPGTVGSANSFAGFLDRKAQVIRPQQDRYLGNLIGKFDITDNVTFFTENLAAKVKAKTLRSVATSNSVGGTALETAPLILNVNNPFLDAADRAALATYGITPTVRNGNFLLSRVNQDILGENANTNTSKTFRSVNGLKGNLDIRGGKQNWEVSATYGRSDLRTTGQSIKDVEFALAVDTVRDSSGQIRCRSQVDPAAALNLTGVQPNIIRRVGADGIAQEVVFTPVATPEIIAACQPLNPFGENQVSQAAKDYVRADQVTNNSNKQLFFQGLLSGNLIDVPAGDLFYALSGEYRTDKLAITQDEIQQLGRTRSAPTSPTRGELVTREIGAELSIPLFGPDFNIPLFQSVEFNPSVRFVKQTGEAPKFRNIAGNVIEPEYKGDWERIYSLAGTWKPINDIKFRGNMTRSLRQPGGVELFLTNQSAFAATLDPCSNQRIGFAPNPTLRRANCQALVQSTTGRTAAEALAFLNTFVSNDISQPVAFAGNSGLRPEKGKSYTFGAIVTPGFLPRLTLSADYINLQLRDQIIPTNPTQAAGFCVDSPTFPDTSAQFGSNLCSFIPRDPVTFQVQPGAAGQFLNLSATEVQGINISGALTVPLPSDFGTMVLRSNAFHLIRYDTSGVGDFSDRSRSAGSFNRPKWEAVSSVRFERNVFYSQLTHRYQSPTKIFSGGAPATIELAEFFEYPEQHMFDLAAGFDLKSGYRLQLSVTNLTDQTTAGLAGRYNGAYFDTLGRRFSIAAGYRF